MPYHPQRQSVSNKFMTHFRRADKIAREFINFERIQRALTPKMNPQRQQGVTPVGTGTRDCGRPGGHSDTFTLQHDLQLILTHLQASQSSSITMALDALLPSELGAGRFCPIDG